MANDRDLVLMHMKKYGAITDEEARDLYGMKLVGITARNIWKRRQNITA